MRIAATIARYLLGLMFTVFGLNGFLMFFPAPPLTGLQGEFLHVMSASHYMLFVSAIQVLCGLLFLANRFVPLALTMLAPVLVNILIYHITMNLPGIVPGVVATVLWLLLISRYWALFAPLLQARAPEQVGARVV